MLLAKNSLKHSTFFVKDKTRPLTKEEILKTKVLTPFPTLTFDSTTMKHLHCTFEYSCCCLDELPENDRKLCQEAINACPSSYAPYSEFHVGAAVLLENGVVVSGNNQENAAYPSGICAERCAIFYANAQHPNTAVQAIAIAAMDKNGNLTDFPITPCGACRQVLLETELRFSTPIRLLLCGKNDVWCIENCNSLLPLHFSAHFF